MYRDQAGGNTADIHRVICIRVKSFQDSEANTFASVPAIRAICVIWWMQQPESRLISRHYVNLFLQEIVNGEKDCTLKEKMLILKKFKETFLYIVYLREYF